MSTSKNRWNKLWSVVLAAAMVCSTITPTAIFAQTEPVDDAQAVEAVVEEEAVEEEVDKEAPEEAVDEEAADEEAIELNVYADDDSGSVDIAITDMDSFTETLATDYSQAAQLPLTGYFYKDIDGRQAKIYISENASIRSYFTVVAVPNEVNTEKFLTEQGWFDVADANGECLLILEPGESGFWGEPEDEIDYVTAAFNFVKSGRNANGVTLFSNFGEFYLAGYGNGATALEYYAVKNPIFIISQYYTDGAPISTELLRAATEFWYDGSNTSGYSAGYKGKDEEFDAVLASLGYDSRLRICEIPVPTWTNNYANSSNTALYWKNANDVYKIPVNGVYWQDVNSTALATLYANECQRARGLNYGISQVKMTKGAAASAQDVYRFLSLYTRYDNTFAYSNALAWRLGYAPATVEAQQNSLKGERTTYTYKMTGGGTGEAQFWGDGDIHVTVPGTESGGTVNVGVIAFADNSRDGEYDPREFIVYIPDTAKFWGEQGAPIIMVYPGNSQTDRIFLDSTQWWKVANDEGAVVAVICETYNRGGVSVSHYNSDLFYYALKAHLAGYISEKYGVALDLGRIYGTGQSAGSMATQGFAFSHPEFFAAVASTSGVSNNGAVYGSIPSYLITGYSDLNNLVPHMDSAPALQSWADYLLGVNGMDKTYADFDDEYGEGGDRWITRVWKNSQDLTLVKWSQNVLRSHNCYPAEMPMLFDFMKHFRLETDEDGFINKRYYSNSGYAVPSQEDVIEIDLPGAPTVDDIESIQAITDETIYGMGVVQVVVTYKPGVYIAPLKAEDFILEDRGSLNPDFGQIEIASAEVKGRTVTLNISNKSQATAANKLVYTGPDSEGSRQRNAFGIYATGAWYRDVNGVIHYGRDDSDAYENNTTGQGYQTRACLELKLRHADEDADAAACLANDQGKYVGFGGKWLPTIDREFTEGGFRDLYDLKIISTGHHDETGIGDMYVRGYYYIPEDYDPANGIVFTLQGQGISYWQLPDGTNDAGTGFTYDSATYSWRNKGAIVVNIHDRSTTSKLPEGYDFVIDDVNVMKYFIDTYQITGNIVLQGNSRGTMASDIVIKALAGCLYNPAQQGMGANAELNKRLDKKYYNFTIDTYICQNGTMGGNLWEDWDAIVDTGLKVWAFDGEQDSNNIDNIAKLRQLYLEAGKSEAWVDENVRLTGYTSLLYYPWGESDHSTTRINGWYFSDAPYYGPDLYIDEETGEIVYNTKLRDGQTYKLTGYGSAATNNKKDYEYTVYDDLFQVWALEDTSAEPTRGTDFDSYRTQLPIDYSQAAQLPLTGFFYKQIDVDGNGEFDEGREVKVYISEETQIRSYFTIIAVPNGVDTYTFLEEEGWFDVADEQGEALFVLEPGKGGWGTAEEEEAYVTKAIAFLTGTQNANRVAVFSTFGEFYVAGYGEGAAPLEAWAAKNPILVIAQAYQFGESAGTEYLNSIASTPYTGKSSNGDISDVLDETIAKVGIDGVIAPKDVAVPTLLINYEGSKDYWKNANDVPEMPILLGVDWQDVNSDNYATHHANQRILRNDPEAKVGLSYVIDQINAGNEGYMPADYLYYDHFASFTRYDTTFPYSNVLSERLNYQEARVAAQREAKDGVVKETLSDGTEIWGQADKVFEGYGTVQVGVIAFADNSGDGKFDPREYIAYIPEGFEGQELPLLMIYAGNSQTDTIFMDSTLWWQLANEKGIVLMFVCETYNRGGVTVSHYNSDGFYYALITLAKEKLDGVYADIDFTRIYASGQSAGSAATQGFAINSPEMFAAVATTSGATSPGNAASNKQIPVMMISGQMDAGDMAQGFNSNSLKNWANYFLQANGAYTAFAAETADSVVSYDSRHPEVYFWNNAQDIPMVGWGQCLLRPHNPYPSEGAYLWDFMSHFCFTKDEDGNVVRYYSPSAFAEEDDLVEIIDSSIGDAVDFDSYTTTLPTDYSQAAQLPLTGYFYKTVADGRKAKIYISDNASIRSYFTVIAVPNGVNTEQFLEEEGWFNVAEAQGECLLILEPTAKGWGSATAENAYITSAFNFVKSGQNANRVSVFSNFGEFYLVGYGAGAAPLEYYAAQNPIFIISQYYTDGVSNTAALLNDETAGAYEYDGSNTSGYSAGYRGKDEEFDAVLAELGYDHRLRKSEIPVPTWFNGYDEDSASVSYWQIANDVNLTKVGNTYWQKLDSKAYATLYANELQAADGKDYGIAQVKVTKDELSSASDIYSFLCCYTRYDNTFAYSNALGWRLDYASATVDAQRNALDNDRLGYAFTWLTRDGKLTNTSEARPEFTYNMLDGATGTAQFWGEGDVVISPYDSDVKGTVNVSVISFADNSGDGENDPREAIIYIPDSARKLGGNGAPIMMVYPGNSQTDRIFMDSTMWWRVANDNGFVVAIVCETYNRGGVSVSHYNSDLFYYALKAYLEGHIAPKYGVRLDMSRIYGTGQSAGSMATQGFAFSHPEFFAAVASTSGVSNNGAVNNSIPSYLITGYSDLNNLVPNMANASALQTWANYLLRVNGIDATYAEPTTEGLELGNRWFTDTWENAEGMNLVKWSQNRLRSHNCYPKEMQMLYDFAKHFSVELDENGRIIARYYSETAFEGNDAVLIDTPDDEPAVDRIVSIQAITDETIYGMGVVEVDVVYNKYVDTSKITADTYILEDRGSLNPDFGQIKIKSVEIDGQTVKLFVSNASQATEVNKLVYTGPNSEGSRQRNAFGIYATGAWYRDVDGVIHYGRNDNDAYENNTTGQGYQTRASLELRLRHEGEAASAAACLANDQGKYAGFGSKWLPTIDREFTEGGFKNLYDLKIISTGIYDQTGIGDKYVQGYYYIPKNYDPANGIVFTLQGQGISFWQLPDGTNDAGTGFTYDSATYSWRNKGAIVVNIHDRSTTSKLPEGYDFVVDDVNVMKYFIDTYQITGNIVIQGNSRGTMASDIVIKALAGCLYSPAQQGMGASAELNRRLDKKYYNFTIDTYICQNGTMGGNMWEADAWEAIVDTGLRVWAFDGEQDSNNIENIARYKELCKAAGYTDAWIEENVRLTGYTSQLYYPWGESDHSTTRINGWYFSDAAYYGPDLTIDPETGEIVYNTKLADGDKYTLTGYGSAATNSKKGYEYTVYDELFQVWALKQAEAPVEPTALEEFVARLYENFLNREPDEKGLADWVEVLTSGRGTGAQVLKGFVLSQEFQNNPLNNEDYVTALYRIIFDREPDEKGLNDWLAVLENGCTRKKVLAGFANSPEFRALCADLGIAPGAYHSDSLADQNPEVAGFVARLYRNVLNRQYEQAGLEAWVTILVTKTAGGAKVAKGFFNSQEFKGLNLSDEEFIKVAYRTLLNREADEKGLADWTKALAEGVTRDKVLEGFYKSPEFAALCASYGIAP